MSDFDELKLGMFGTFGITGISLLFVQVSPGGKLKIDRQGRAGGVRFLIEFGSLAKSANSAACAIKLLT